MTAPTILQSSNERAKLMRRDTAEILTRLYFIERSMIISLSGWLTRAPRLEDKAAFGRMLWEDSLAADNLRERIFELRFPRRDINLDLHQSIIALYDEGRNAPSVEAFVAGLVRVLKPALLEAYASYNELSDRLSDGPSALILRHAMNDLSAQIVDLNTILDLMLAQNPDEGARADRWSSALQSQLLAMGGSVLDVTSEAPAQLPQMPERVPFMLPERPGRDARFLNMRFYWPHIVDPSFPSEEGIYLQLRSAVGHLNEAWAAEAAAVTLYYFADELDWEFIRDTARWTYDESRHCLMGYQRLLDWGFQPEELPMGDYLYTTSVGAGSVYPLAMLHHFETKYIHRGHDRIDTFKAIEDTASRHDYEFDWADETFHAEYGRRWLEELLAKPAYAGNNVDSIRDHCAELVAATVATATDQERQLITSIAQRMITKAQSRLTSAG